MPGQLDSRRERGAALLASVFRRRFRRFRVVPRIDYQPCRRRPWPRLPRGSFLANRSGCRAELPRRRVAAAPRVPRGYFRTGAARRAGAALDSFEPAPRERLVAQLAGCGAALEGRAAGGHERCGAPDPRRAPKTRRQPHQSSPAQTATKPSNNHGPAPPAGRRAGAPAVAAVDELAAAWRRPAPARARAAEEGADVIARGADHAREASAAGVGENARGAFVSPNAAAERSDSSSGRAEGVLGRARRRGDGSQRRRGRDV